MGIRALKVGDDVEVIGKMCRSKYNFNLPFVFLSPGPMSLHS